MVLPPCPLRLQSSFVWKNLLAGTIMLAIGVAAAVGYAWWQYDSVVELLDQTRVWRAGVPAPQTEVKGEVTTRKFVFRSYDLNVRFVDQKGALHEGKLTFDTLGGEVDQKRDPAVRYLEGAPDRFALSWAMEVTTSRWVAIIFMAVVGVGLVAGSFAYLGWLCLRRLADARRCAARSDEVVVRITKVVAQMVHGRQAGTTYHFEGQTVDGRSVAGRAVMQKNQTPLFADAAQQTMVVLVPPENPKRAVVLRQDFHPFLLTTDEQAQARAAIARGAMAHG